MNVSEFKTIIYKLRSEIELTQGEFAKEIGVSKSTVAMWETGKRLPSPELYEQIADYFNVDIDYLYGRSPIRQRVHFDKDGNAQRTLSPDESGLLDDYQKLNALGKKKAREDLADLTEIPRYIEDTGLSGESAG